MESVVHSSQIDPHLVSIKAYEIWEAMGRPDGAAEQTWLEAERQLRQTVRTPTGSTPPAAKSGASQPASIPAAVVAAKSDPAKADPDVVSNVASQSQNLSAKAAESGPRKSEPPSSPNVNGTQKKATNGSRRGARR